MSEVGLVETEPISPEQRASIVLYVAENFATADYMIAERIGVGLFATVSALEEMVDSGEVKQASQAGNAYWINGEQEAETYADALPHASIEHLLRLSSLGEGETDKQLLISWKTFESLYGALKLAAKMEIYARMKRAERSEQSVTQ